MARIQVKEGTRYVFKKQIYRVKHWTFDKVNQAQLQLSADQNVTK